MKYTVIDGSTQKPVTNVTVQTISISTSELFFEPVKLDATAQFEIAPVKGYGVKITAPGYKKTVATIESAQSDGFILLYKKSMLWPLLIVPVAYYATKKKSIGGNNTETAKDAVFIGAGLAGVYLIKTLLDKLGLGGNPGQGQLSDPNSAFNPNYWKQFGTYSFVINEQQAIAFSKTIHDAFTLFQDDFNAVFSVFSQMKTKANVSYLADVFAKKYSENLLSFLNDGGGVLPWDGLSSENMQTILNYVSKLRNN